MKRFSNILSAVTVLVFTLLNCGGVFATQYFENFKYSGEHRNRCDTNESKAAFASKYNTFRTAQVKEKEEFYKNLSNELEKEWQKLKAEKDPLIEEAEKRGDINEKKKLLKELNDFYETRRAEKTKAFEQKQASELATKKEQLKAERLKQYQNWRFITHWSFELHASSKDRPLGGRYHCEFPHLDCVYPQTVPQGGSWTYTKNITKESQIKIDRYGKGRNTIEDLVVKVVDGKSASRRAVSGMPKEGVAPLSIPVSGINLYVRLKGNDFNSHTARVRVSFDLEYRLLDERAKAFCEQDCRNVFK